MSPGSTTVHVSSTSSAHVPSWHWASSAHVTPSGSHAAPHWSAPGGSAQAGNGAATPAEVSTAMEASSEGWGRQEATRWTVEAAARAGSCETDQRQVSMDVFQLLKYTKKKKLLPTSSEVSSVLEASTAAPSLSRSATTVKLVLASPAATTQTAASFWCCAPLVGFLLSRQSGLAFFFVLFQQLGGLLLLQLAVDDVVEALAGLGQRVEACNGKEIKIPDHD